MLHGKSRVLGGVLPAVCALLSPVPGERRVYVLESDICPFLSQTFEHLPSDYHGPGASHLGSNNSASERLTRFSRQLLTGEPPPKLTPQTV